LRGTNPRGVASYAGVQVVCVAAFLDATLPAEGKILMPNLDGLLVAFNTVPMQRQTSYLRCIYRAGWALARPWPRCCTRNRPIGGAKHPRIGAPANACQLAAGG
jgi:hypothetical protein